jgi:hypothetical protein
MRAHRSAQRHVQHADVVAGLVRDDPLDAADHIEIAAGAGAVQRLYRYEVDAGRDALEAAGARDRGIANDRGDVRAVAEAVVVVGRIRAALDRVVLREHALILAV